MAYQMRKQFGGNFLIGQAIVKTNQEYPGKFRVQLTYTSQEGEKVTKKYTVDKANAPSFLTAGEWSIRLNASDEPKIMSAYPSNDVLECRFHSIVSKDGEAPAPKEKVGQFGPYQVFTILLECVEKKYQPKRSDEDKMLIPLNLTYKFVRGYDPKVGEVADYKGKSGAALELLMAAMESLGILENIDGTDKPLLWKDNLLPVIQQRAKKHADNGRIVRVTINNGYTIGIRNKVVKEEVEEDEDTWDEEEEVVVKTKAPKAPAPKVKVEADPDEDEPELFGTGETKTEQKVKVKVPASDPPWGDDDDEISMDE